MRIHLYDKFTYKKIFRFVLPSVVMMVFTSVYGVVDGFFVSNFAGKTPFAAVNLIYPFVMVLGAFGFMFGTGGSALVAKTLGEGDKRRAQELFSTFIYISIGLGIVISALGIIFIEPVAKLLGAEGEMLDNCVIYGRIILTAIPALMLQFCFQSFCVTAEKPKLGLVATIAAGITNMALDGILVGIFPFGIVGAAVATALSQYVGGIIPLVYFCSKHNDSLLRMTKPRFDLRAILKGCTNGSSELLSNVSMSLVSMIYNYKLIDLAGENGVAAYGVIMYVNFFFLSVFIGYSVGTAPIVGYKFGAGDKGQLKDILRKSAVIMSVCSVFMLALSQLLAVPISEVFVGYDEALFELTLRGFRIFSFSFLFAGIAIYGSSFFTALNNGLVSAVISFLRTLVFEVAAVLLLPIWWGVDGIWSSIIVAEALAVTVTVVFLALNRKKYGY